MNVIMSAPCLLSLQLYFWVANEVYHTLSVLNIRMVAPSRGAIARVRDARLRRQCWGGRGSKGLLRYNPNH